MLIPNKKAKVITTDTRAFWVAIKTEITSKVLMASCGLMTEKEYKAEVAALELVGRKIFSASDEQNRIFKKNNLGGIKMLVTKKEEASKALVAFTGNNFQFEK